MLPPLFYFTTPSSFLSEMTNFFFFPPEKKVGVEKKIAGNHLPSFLPVYCTRGFYLFSQREREEKSKIPSGVPRSSSEFSITTFIIIVIIWWRWRSYSVYIRDWGSRGGDKFLKFITHWMRGLSLYMNKFSLVEGES